MYFYNTQTHISKTLKTEQQYLNTVTKRALCFCKVCRVSNATKILFEISWLW